MNLYDLYEKPEQLHGYSIKENYVWGDMNTTFVLCSTIALKKETIL